MRKCGAVELQVRSGTEFEGVMLDSTKSDNIIRALANHRMALMLPLGFVSGLPLSLTGQTLQAWLSVEGIALGTIGIFTLVGIPYTLKFLWSPLMDRDVPPWLGRRRGWMMATQLALFTVIAAMATTVQGGFHRLVDVRKI